jgi:PAS domain S-box-containing protein
MPAFDAKQYAAILEQSGDAFIFANTAGVVEIWNEAAAALFGYSAREVAGASMDLIIPDKLRAAHWTGFRRAMETGTTRLSGRPTITRATHKSGARLYVEMTFAVVRADDGTTMGAVAVARDATERYLASRPIAASRAM